MSYCFIANYHLTPLQIEIARRLEQEGTPCVFVTVNSSLANDISNAGWSGDRLLHLTLDPVCHERAFDQFAIRFNDLIFADRALRHTPEAGLQFLQKSARELHAFFELNDVRFVFSEPTWAHERVAAALCEAVEHRTFLTPFTIRYPSGQMAFFENGNQDCLYPLATISAEPHILSSAEVANSAPPTYLQRNDQLLKEAGTISARFAKLARFLTRINIDPSDPTHVQSRWKTLKIKGGEEVNRMLYRYIPRRSFDDQVFNKPFVIFALHKQPESSIDVLGRYYEDQIALIQAIWRSLPVGWILMVKEHSNAIGDRSPAFYRQLRRWPGLELIDEKISMPRLLERAQAVFTVSGTVAYEAALKGVPAFTFAPMFFNRFDSCRRITIEDLRAARDIAELIEAMPVPSAEVNDATIAKIQSHSFTGRFTDDVSDPYVLETANIDNIMAGFRRLSVRK